LTSLVQFATFRRHLAADPLPPACKRVRSALVTADSSVSRGKGNNRTLLEHRLQCHEGISLVAQPIEPPPVKLIVGLIVTLDAPVAAVRRQFEASYGRIDLEIDRFPFEATRYYEREMGPQLQRLFWSFETLVAPETLADIKRETNAIEQIYAIPDGPGGRRCVNLDPGYMDLAKLVLATTKDQQHRLYLGRGIYAEVTLRFTGGRFMPWEWTYPDYRTPGYMAFFDAVRRRYRQQLTALLAEPYHV
jgi:hypothetical protein